MLTKLLKQMKRFLKQFNKLSIWFRLSIVILIILLSCVIANKYSPRIENFAQEKKFVMKQGPAIYDNFYANIYDDLVHDKIKNEYEVKEIVHLTNPTKQSLILDVGCGTGKHVAEFNKKGFNAVGLDLSPSMINKSKKSNPNLKFKQGNALEFMLYPANSFSHITCLYFTLYYIKDKKQFLNNCYDWLRPGGYLTVHLVDREKFDPILNSADPLQMISAQRYAKKRITNSLIKFKDFRYRGDFKLDKENDKATFEEIFKDDKTKHIRQNIHKMEMPTRKYIISLAKECGFIVEGKVDMVPVQYEYQYLYIFKKPR